MATSGSVDFSMDRDDLIEDALRAVGALGPDDSATASQITHAARLLNMIVKGWQSHGISLWARKTGYVLPQTGTNVIELGPTGDHATLSYVQTTATSGSGTTLVVASATGISDTYNIGIEMDGGDMHWTTVSGAPVGTTVTLTDALTSTVSSGARVYCYQTKLVRPLRITDAYLHNVNGHDTPITIVPKADYDMLGRKDSAGLMNQISYDPQLVDGHLYVWPQFQDGADVLTIIFQRPFEDFDADTDTPDFPQEWYMAIYYALAVALSPVYGVPAADRNLLKQEMTTWFGEALSNEPEQGSFRIQIDSRG